MPIVSTASAARSIAANSAALAVGPSISVRPTGTATRVEHLSGRWALLAFAAVMAAAAVLCFAQPGFRNAEADAAATESAVAEAG